MTVHRTDADIDPHSAAWHRLSRRRQIAVRWEWQRQCSVQSWYLWHELSHPDGFRVPPDPVNLATQLEYHGA